ncbi:MAG TPA: hypothetical protein VEA69_15485 [Tepidisphaeraceae bacterium]|nr:hypothetical protein [Tepidisphaeraceae bacterium]
MELMRHTEMAMTMKVSTDPRIFDPSGAIDRPPLPGANATGEAVRATGTLGGAKDPEARVAERVARATLDRRSETFTGTPSDRANSRPSAFAGMDRQQKTPSGGEGVSVRHLGLEPRTR